jgi:RNA polymerase sigma factor (sigma-70 family)
MAGYNSPGFIHLESVRHPSEPTDAELVHAEAADAFGELYKRHVAAVHAWFRGRLEWAASDLTAETFAQAFEHRRRFRGSTDAEATGWLYGIARHQLSRYARRGVVEHKALRRLSIQLPAVGEGDYERIAELAGFAELRDRVATVFGELSDAQRDALRLRVIDERPYAEVAERLGISEQTARARVSRALRSLADAIDMTSPAEVTP